VVTHAPESAVNLAVALKLRDTLQKQGVKVILVRDSQNANVSNSQRAAIANEANADLFVRLHCDGSDSDPGRTGLSTLIPGKNQWTGPILAESEKAGRLVHSFVVTASGAVDRGVVKRADLAGFNWSKVPTVLVEMGFMSNAAEDRKLSSGPYQDKLASGIAQGVTAYLKSR